MLTPQARVVLRIVVAVDDGGGGSDRDVASVVAVVLLMAMMMVISLLVSLCSGVNCDCCCVRYIPYPSRAAR